VERDGAWEIVETREAVAGDALFEWERAAMGDEELESLIRRLGYARAELLASIEGVADAVLDWEPPRSAFASFDAWAPEVRTIRDVARHVFQFEPYYRDGLRDGPAAGIYERVSDPETEHALTVERLRSMSAADRSRVWRPLRPGGSEPEEWTLRKVVRRMVSHDRAHTAEIWQRRSWVLLGAPGVVS
jgi:hypothetical protein